MQLQGNVTPPGLPGPGVLAPIGRQRRAGPGDSPPAKRPVALSALLGQEMQQGPLLNINELNAKVSELHHDMERVKRRIVDLAELPCSVIIVGLGDDDFGMMDELDGDENRVTDDDDRVAARDIVQFVEFDKCMKDNLNLAELVLEEIPE